MLQALHAVDHHVQTERVDRLRDELESFAGEMLASVRREDQRRWGACYLRGLMVDGKRKDAPGGMPATWVPTASCPARRST